MKTDISRTFFILVAVSILINSCTKETVKNPIPNEESTLIDDNLLTDELLKIETIYEEGDYKFEGFLPGLIEEETSASQAYKDKIKIELDRSFSKQVSYLKSEDNLVGVFKSAESCGSYSQLLVNMDCEDTSPGSYYSGYTGDSYITPTYYNAVLNFCIVDNAYFTQVNEMDYGILMLTAITPDGVNKITRYFDNEDTHNGNYFQKDGEEYWGWYGDCYFSNNTRLSFLYYTISTSGDFPNLGFSYLVLGHNLSLSRGLIYTDDENYRNANWCKKYMWNGSSWDESTVTSIPDMLTATANTTLYLVEAEEL